jgi:hypothetical protein
MDLSPWRATLGREESFCPDCPYNLEDRNRGRVEIQDAFGEGAQALLYKQEPQTSEVPFALFESIPLPKRRGGDPIRLSLAGGSYRLSCWREGMLLGERDFLVDANAPLQNLRIIPLPERDLFFEVEIDLAAVAEAARAFPLDDDVSLEGISPLRTVWIARRPVTNREMLEFASSVSLPGPSLLALIDRDPEHSEEPCSVPPIGAAAYCAWKGCRLPTVAELLLAMEHREFQPAGDSEFGEISGTPGQDGMQRTVIYDKLMPGLLPQDAIDRTRCFRMAFSGQPQEVSSGR